MKRSALVLAAATATLLSGCGSDPAVTPAAAHSVLPTETSASLPSDPARTPSMPVVAPAYKAPAKPTTSRPSNALSWAQPSISNEDLDRAVRITWAG